MLIQAEEGNVSDAGLQVSHIFISNSCRKTEDATLKMRKCWFEMM